MDLGPRMRIEFDEHVLALGIWLHFDPVDEVWFSITIGPWAFEVLILKPREEY
jgi:hypothetical protein